MGLFVWSCKVCTYRHETRGVICSMCDSPRTPQGCDDDRATPSRAGASVPVSAASRCGPDSKPAAKRTKKAHFGVQSGSIVSPENTEHCGRVSQSAAASGSRRLFPCQDSVGGSGHIGRSSDTCNKERPASVVPQMGVAYAATGRCPSLSHPELVRRGDFGCYIGGALYVLYNPKDMAPAVGCWDGGKEPTGAKGRWCAYNEAVNWRRESGGGASVVPPEGSQVFVKSFPACDDDVLVAFTEVSRAFDWNDLPRGLSVAAERVDRDRDSFVLRVDDDVEEIPDVVLEAASRACEACRVLYRGDKPGYPYAKSV